MRLNFPTKIRWVKETTRTWQLLTDKELAHPKNRFSREPVRIDYEWYILDGNLRGFLEDNNRLLYSSELEKISSSYMEKILRENKDRIDTVQRGYGQKRTKFWKIYWSWEIKVEKV